MLYVCARANVRERVRERVCVCIPSVFPNLLNSKDSYKRVVVKSRVNVVVVVKSRVNVVVVWKSRVNVVAGPVFPCSLGLTLEDPDS